MTGIFQLISLPKWARYRLTKQCISPVSLAPIRKGNVSCKRQSTLSAGRADELITRPAHPAAPAGTGRAHEKKATTSQSWLHPRVKISDSGPYLITLPNGQPFLRRRLRLRPIRPSPSRAMLVGSGTGTPLKTTSREPFRTWRPVGSKLFNWPDWNDS